MAGCGTHHVRLLPDNRIILDMKKQIFIFFLFLLTASASLAQNYSQAQVRQRINNIASHMRSMTCNFVQVKTLKMVRSKVVSRGNMYYSRPGRLRWEYTSPYRYTFILNGQTVLLKNARGNSRINVEQSKMFKEITRIMMSSVLGTCVSDNRDFTVSLQGPGNSWQAVMAPKRNPMKQMFSTIVVYFDMARSIVSSVKMVERNGDTTVIQLKNVRTNVPVNARVFSLN